MQAAGVFFSLLEKDVKQIDNHIDAGSEICLSDVVKPKLYEDLHQHHSSLAQQGLQMKVDLTELHSPTLGDSWISFGPASHVDTTLKAVPVFRKIDLDNIIRGNSKEGYFYRQLMFEYYFTDVKALIDAETSEFKPPSLQQRAAVAKQGAVAGVDISFTAKFTLSISDTADPSKTWHATIDRPVLFRFETLHFKGMSDSQWKIADVDNYLASQMF